MPIPRPSRGPLVRAPRSRPLAAVAGALASLLSACGDGAPVGPGAIREPAAARPAIAASTPRVALYVHAHQDDWQLFMGDRANASYASGTRVVWVYATAGDGGRGTTYWQARESGARASMDAVVGTGSWTCATRTVGTHPIRRCTKGNAVAWYMRLPNYNPLGTGAGAYGRLQQLHDDGTDVTTVDGTTTYTSWADFTATVRGIVDLEAGGASASGVAVNAPDHSRTANPDDHSDHYATADAVRAAAAGRAWDLTWFVDYDTDTRPANLGTADYAVKQREFRVYDSVMVARGYASLAGNVSYQAWQARTYFRTEPYEPPAGPPTASAGGPYAAAEGTAIAFSSAGSGDPSGGTVTYRWAFGDGTSSTAANPSKAYADNGTYTVSLTVTNAAGAASTATTSATITNVAPTATFTVPSATEGTAYTLALSGTDAGSADRASLQYAFDCGQGAGYSAFGTTRSVTCPAVRDQRTLAVRGQVRDKNGAATAYSRSLTVGNAAPVVSFAATSGTTLTAGSTFRAQGSFTDKGAGDAPWTYTVNWGDGTTATTGSVTAQGTLPAVSHVYSKTGTWSATLTVRDKDGASRTSAAITVRVGVTPPSALQARGYKVKGVQHAQLSWTKGSATRVDVWRSGTRIRSAITNSGSLTDAIGRKGGGSYTYRVCVAGQTATASCSNSAAITF